MSLTVLITEFSCAEDMDDVLDLWRNAGEGIQLRDSDKPEEIRKKLLRDPDLFLVARLDSRLVGAVMGGFDGRRGFVYHLAVAPDCRGQGIARKLMDEVERRLRDKGCLKINLMVTHGNDGAAAFYKELGYQPMPVTPYGKSLI